MKFLFLTKSIIYISLEFLFAYKLEKSNNLNRKYFYLLASSIIIFEIIKIKNYNFDFWDRQALGFLLGYCLYSFIKNQIKKRLA